MTWIGTHRVWRAIAPRMSQRWREEALPGYPYLQWFVFTFIGVEPKMREPIIVGYLTQRNSPWRRALRRAGGPRAAFRLVLGAAAEVDLSAFKTPERPEPTIRDVADACTQITAALIEVNLEAEGQNITLERA
jgi:hypothetical protein